MVLYEIIIREEFKCQNGTHPKDALLIVLNGSFACSIDGKNHIARENDVFVFRANTPFNRRSLETLRCVYIQFDELPFSFKNGIMPLSDPVRAASTISLLEKAITEENKAKAIHYINDLLFLDPSSNTPCKAHIEEGTAECIAFLKENYDRFITLDTLAQRFYVSKQWLIRKFKAETGTTPIEYLNNFRIRQAQELLTYTELPIGEIATKCGYDNIYYFSKSFRKKVGFSPKEYRKSFQL